MSLPNGQRNADAQERVTRTSTVDDKGDVIVS